MVGISIAVPGSSPGTSRERREEALGFAPSELDGEPANTVPAEIQRAEALAVMHANRGGPPAPIIDPRDAATSPFGEVTIHLHDHSQCEQVSERLRGKLCEQLAQRPGRHAAAGEFVYLTGGEAKSLFFLKRGLVKTSRIASDGRELILQIHRPGEVFGELCFCTGMRREQAAVLEPSDLVELPFDELLSQLRRNPETMLDLVELTAERLSEAQAMLQSVAFDSTMARLIRTLLAMAERLGNESLDGVRIGHYITQ